MLLLPNNLDPFPLFVNRPTPFPLPNKLILEKRFEGFEGPPKILFEAFGYDFIEGYNEGSPFSFLGIF